MGGETRIAEAATLLLVVVAIAAALRWLWPDAPWSAWALVWLFAVKWMLVLATAPLAGDHPGDGQ